MEIIGYTITLILSALGTYAIYLVKKYLNEKKLTYLSQIAEKAIQLAQNMANNKIKKGLEKVVSGSERAQYALNWIDQNIDTLGLKEWEVKLVKSLLPAVYEDLKVGGKIRKVSV